MNAGFSIKKLIKSFGYAFNGIKAALRSEQNFRVHLLAACVAIALGFFLRISTVEFVIIIICIGVVMAAELINTTIEKLCDFISPEYHERIKVIKDLAAAAVLLVAIAALIVGLIIFLPKVFFIFAVNGC